MNNKTTTKIIGVWGTLKRGQYNHSLFMKNAKFLGEDLLDNLGNNHNSIQIDRTPEGLAKIELFEIPLNDYQIIDKLENHYNYQAQLTKLESGKTAIIWFHNNQL